MFLTFQPHLLVLDIGLPDGDGFNVVDWLREQESLPRLPLVVYSGRDLTPAGRRQADAGSDLLSHQGARAAGAT